MKKSPIWTTEKEEEYRIDNGTTVERDEYRLSVSDYIVLRYLQKSTLIK